MPGVVAVLCCLGICVLCCAERWRSRLARRVGFFFRGPGVSLYSVGELQGASSSRGGSTDQIQASPPVMVGWASVFCITWPLELAPVSQTNPSRPPLLSPAGIVVGTANSSPRQRPLNGLWRRTCISHSPAFCPTLVPKPPLQPQHPKKELTTFLQYSFHLHSRLPRSHQHNPATTAQRIFQLIFDSYPLSQSNNGSRRPISLLAVSAIISVISLYYTPHYPKAHVHLYHHSHYIPHLQQPHSITNASHHMSFPPFLPSNSET